MREPDGRQSRLVRRAVGAAWQRFNAGLIRPDATGRTVDGFETTLAVNHLAHYLLVRLLLPALAEGAIVLLTTSGTHDPATKASLATPRHADAALLADPDRDPELESQPRKAGEHAYVRSSDRDAPRRCRAGLCRAPRTSRPQLHAGCSRGSARDLRVMTGHVVLLATVLSGLLAGVFVAFSLLVTLVITFLGNVPRTLTSTAALACLARR